MKLLLDQNLSPRLVASLRRAYPGSTHVREVGLGSATDEAVWNYAADHGFAIVSKDADFHQRSFLLGPPPKVIYIRCGNCSTRDIEGILKAHRQNLKKFGFFSEKCEEQNPLICQRVFHRLPYEALWPGPEGLSGEPMRGG